MTLKIEEMRANRHNELRQSFLLNTSRERGSVSNANKMGGRRSLSDSIISRTSSSNGKPSNFPRTNATFALVQRSGAPVIREMISFIIERTSSGITPDSQCNELANAASDPYYRVVIAASGGIQAVVKAMSTFPGCENLQASACSALASMCTSNSSNQVISQKEGGMDAVLAAMRLFPLSIAIQASACDALHQLTSMSRDNAVILRNIPDSVPLLRHALQRFLPPSCRENGETVMRKIS